MANLPIQPPNKRKWPDYFGEQRTPRSDIQSDPATKSLIDSRQLLTVELNKLLADILSTGTEIEVLLQSLSKNSISVTEVLKQQISERAVELINQRYKQGDDIEKLRKEAVTEAIGLTLFKEKQIMIDQMVSKSNDLLDILDQYLKTSRLDLSSLLETVPLFFCKSCSSLFGRARFQSGKCNFCGTIVTTSNQTNQQTYRRIKPIVKIFFQQNIWLEYGVEGLFKRAGFNTACGVHVMGSSGVMHEIDTLAENSRTLNRVLVECKNRAISIDDIFKLHGKMLDLGCNYGLIFTTSAEVYPDLQRMAKANNIKIYLNILGANESEIVKDLQQEIIA